MGSANLLGALRRELAAAAVRPLRRLALWFARRANARYVARHAAPEYLQARRTREGAR